MASLCDRIDRLAATADAIRASAAAVRPAPAATPFTRAVLDTALGDLIRDVDVSELGLFSLVSAPDNAPRRGAISRVGFPGATPLRKQPASRDDMCEPELYARAALQYLDRYQSIRRMPRARSQAVALIEQLHDAHVNIKRLSETLQELTTAGATSAPSLRISGVAEEERRITDLQNRLSELRRQKDALLRSNDPKPAVKRNVPFKHIPKPSPAPSPRPENHEDVFWSTPAASARTLRFTDRLLEEDPDFAELSAMSFDSPGPAPPRSVFASLADKGFTTLSDDTVFGRDHPQLHQGQEEGAEEDPHDQSTLPELAPESELDPELSLPDVPEPEEDPEEKTVVLSKAPLPALDNPLSSPPLAEAHPPPDSSLKIPKVRFTPELERIMARIWNTVGDVLVPGKGGEKPPRAKDTLVLIESLVTQSPSPGSPTSSSISSLASATAGPTPHQVNTAQLLHALLAAPNHAMPLNQLKVVIGGTRALYGCVAKKLIRIDRGGGEQIVLFDA